MSTGSAFNFNAFKGSHSGPGTPYPPGRDRNSKGHYLQVSSGLPQDFVGDDHCGESTRRTMRHRGQVTAKHREEEPPAGGSVAWTALNTGPDRSTQGPACAIMCPMAKTLSRRVDHKHLKSSLRHSLSGTRKAEQAMLLHRAKHQGPVSPVAAQRPQIHLCEAQTADRPALSARSSTMGGKHLCGAMFDPEALRASSSGPGESNPGHFCLFCLPQSSVLPQGQVHPAGTGVGCWWQGCC